MYKPIVKPNQLKAGEGDSAFITGWTPKKHIIQKLKDYAYGVIGQLYSPKRGIDLTIRNLLANPQITKVFCLALTKADNNVQSSKCLYDFFHNGVSFDKTLNLWKINSDIEGYIDADIPLIDLNELRTSIECYYYKNKKVFLQNLLESNVHSNTLPVVRNAKVYPKKETIQKETIGELYGHTIKSDNIMTAWVKQLHLIRRCGKIRPTGYDGNWQELINLVTIVENEPDEYYFPNFMPSKEAIANYIPYMVNDAEYNDLTKYTYGQRLRSWFGVDQVNQVIEKLIKEKDSASAVMSLWDSGSGNHLNESIARHNRKNGDSDHNNSGSPCLNHIWVRIVDNELVLTATFRSNDMFSAWVTNACGLRALQKHIFTQLKEKTDYNLVLGKLITISQSAHIYDDCFDSADELLSKYNQPTQPLHDDKVGNFLIEYDKQIIIKHYALNGSLVNVFKGNNPLAILNQITNYNPDINPFHIGYIGLEVQKAISQKEAYIQDR